jgi:hypothetical protein
MGILTIFETARTIQDPQHVLMFVVGKLRGGSSS